jgi:O-antigen ligase
MFVRHPLLGVGLKDYVTEEINYLSFTEIHWAVLGNCHNAYLAVAAETGLMGLVPMVLLVIGAFRTCWRYYIVAKDRGRREVLWGAMMMALTLVYFLSAMTFNVFFEATIDNKLYYLLLGITAGQLTAVSGGSGELAS